MHRIFAYGSNMDLDQMCARCSGASLLGPATLRGHRLLINQRGVATVEQHASYDVYGVLWVVTAAHLERLDVFEGVALGHYVRTSFAVETGRGAPIEAIAYRALDSTPGAPRAGYLELVLQAAERQNLPREYLLELSEWCQR